MAMSKKDFIALADTIREHNRIAVNRRAHDDFSMGLFYNDQIEALADFCRSQNSNFMRARWLGYIAGENGKNGGRV